MPQVAKRIENVPSSGIRKFFDMAAELENPINFSIGQPDFKVPKEIQQGFLEALEKHEFSYTPTQGILPLREKIYHKFKHQNKILCCNSPNDVLVTAGVSGGLFLALSSLLDPDDEIIVNTPYFVIYKVLADFLGAHTKLIPTDKNFDIDCEQIEKAITPKTKCIIVNSPCNPTGKVISQEELEKLASIAKKHDLVILSDEIYEDFLYEEKKHFSIGSIYEHTITLNGFSKSLAIPGMRIGYLTAPQYLIEPMAKLSQYTFVCAPSLTQHACVKAFDIDLSPIIAAYEQKRNIVYEGLKDHFDITKPEGAFYAYVKSPNGLSASAFVEKAIKSHVLIVPGGAFSPEDTHFRISFAADDEVLKKGVEVLCKLSKSE